MTHSTATFTFINTKREKVELTTKPYTLNLESLFKDFIGKEAWDKYRKDNKIEVEVSEELINKYYPHLLDGDTSSINWGEQDYDEVYRVVAFFLRYRKNAELRHLKNEENTLASIINSSQQLLTLFQNSGLEKTV